ncbi:MAG: DUF58 domain-containing protein [Verrucomicrobiota bacterium]
MKSEWSFLDPAALNRLKAWPLVAKRPMQGNVAGRHRSLHRGSSVEFAEYRKYVPGDDPRRLDWRVFARTDRFFSKEFEADTNLRCCLVVDSSGSMGFGSAGPSKFEFASQLAATLSWLVVNQGEAVGLSCVAADVIHHIPTSRRPAHLQLLFKTLEALKAEGETQLGQHLHDLAERVAQRALVVVISDFLEDTDALLEGLRHLRFRKHDVAVFHLVDPLEKEFDFESPRRFTDLEDGTALPVDPILIADRYREAMQAHLSTLREGCRAAEIDYFEALVNDGTETLLARFLQSRA